MALRDQDALDYHYLGRPGKIEVVPTKPCVTPRDLSLAYTPGVAEPCLAIEKNPADAYKYTAKGNLVAVISNGTAVLGLGDIGALAGKPVMEGKGVLFKRFADIDVFDIEVDTHDPDEIIKVCQLLEPTFGGINLEDIKAPECFYIEETLKKTMKIPVFHDDQHGTAIISGAGADQRLRDHRARHQVGEGRHLRRRRRGHRLRQVLRAARRAARELHPGRHQGRHLQGPHRGHEPVQGVLRPQDQGPHAGRRDEGRRRLPRPLRQGPGHAGHGALDGEEPDRLRDGQPRPGDHLRRRAGRAHGRHHGHRPLRLPEPGQQRARLPVHLPRRARRARHGDQRGDEAGGGARAGRPGAPAVPDKVSRGLRRPALRVRARVHHPQAVRPPRPALGGPRRGEGRLQDQGRPAADHGLGRLPQPPRGPDQQERRRSCGPCGRRPPASASASSSPRARRRA